MITSDENGRLASPMRLLEMLTARFGAFESIASLTLELNRKGPDECLPLDAPTAEALLQFGDDLRQAENTVRLWASARGLCPYTRVWRVWRWRASGSILPARRAWPPPCSASETCGSTRARAIPRCSAATATWTS